MSELADAVNNLDRAGSGLPDFPGIEQRLRDDLNAALERLNQTREKMSCASEVHGPESAEAHRASGDHAQALADLERASVRFSEFVLNCIIPADIQTSSR